MSKITPVHRIRYTRKGVIFNGKEMRYHVVYYGTQPIETVTLDKGVELAEEIGNEVNFLLSAAPLCMLVVPPSAVGYETVNLGLTLAGSAVGIASYIKNKYGVTVITGRTDDFCEINFDYKYYEKYVEVNTDTLGWCLAVTTTKADIIQGTYRVVIHLPNGDLIDENLIVPRFIVQGESYNNPWQTAYNHMFFALQENVELKLDDNTEVRFGDFIWE